MKLKELELDNKSTPEFAVSRLFKNWKEKDFKKVNKYIQKTWLSNSHEKEFEKMFGGFELVDYCIIDKEEITDCRQEVDFRVDMIFRDKKITRYGKANTICETGPYNPSPDGKWGVNPISLLRWRK
jgi:restriction endonuclease S subunit